MLECARSKWADLRDWFKGLPDAAPKALGDLGNVLVNAGKALLKGFISGIKSMLGGVKDTLGGLTNSLTSWKGPPQRDAVILRPAGRLVMAGFTDGITDALPYVRTRLQAVTNEIAAYRPTIAPQLDTPPDGFAASGRQTSGPAMSIDTFIA